LLYTDVGNQWLTRITGSTGGRGTGASKKRKNDEIIVSVVSVVHCTSESEPWSWQRDAARTRRRGRPRYASAAPRHDSKVGVTEERAGKWSGWLKRVLPKLRTKKVRARWQS